MSDLRAARRAYYSGGEKPDALKIRARRLLVFLADNFPAYIQRRGLQDIVFEGEHFWSGDCIRALRWLEDEGYVERDPRVRGYWRCSEQGLNAVKNLPEPWGGAA